MRSGGIGATSLNYTGQRRDATGLLYYHARYYDPSIGRFISADSVVPSSPAGSMDGTALKPLTTDRHEPGFLSTLNTESAAPFWFQLSNDQRQQLGAPWGPANPQALNRYAYVLNNPVRWTDPGGHWTFSIGLGKSAFALVGIRGDVAVTFDLQGNVGIFATGGGGGYAGVGANDGLSFTVTNAPSVYDLQGSATQLGVSLGEGIIGSAEISFFKSSGESYSGLSLGAKAAIQTPLEVHVTTTYSIGASCHLPTMCGLRHTDNASPVVHPEYAHNHQPINRHTRRTPPPHQKTPE